MNIGIDVDGVLCDLEWFQKTYAIPFFEKRGFTLLDEDAYDVKEMFGCSKKDHLSFWGLRIIKYALAMPARENAAEVLLRLHEDGHKVFIVTGRVCVTEKSLFGSAHRWMLRHWLKRNNLYYDDIFFCSEKNSAQDKAKACKELGIEGNFEQLNDYPANNNLKYVISWIGSN